MLPAIRRRDPHNNSPAMPSKKKNRIARKREKRLQQAVQHADTGEAGDWESTVVRDEPPEEVYKDDGTGWEKDF